MSIYTHYTIEATHGSERYTYGIHSQVSMNTKTTMDTKAAKNHPTSAQRTRQSMSLATQSQQQIMTST